MDKHIPTPWKNNGGQIEGPGGYPNIVAHVGIVNEQTELDTANAAFIVRAVNAHEEMLVLIKKLWEDHQIIEPHHQIGCDLCVHSAKIISKAEGA